MRFNLPVNNFTSGEWSLKMSGRTDTEQYARSCRDLTNMIVQMQGGARYRSGFSRLHVYALGIPVLGDVELDDAFALATALTPAIKLIKYRNETLNKEVALRIAPGASTTDFKIIDPETGVFSFLNGADVPSIASAYNTDYSDCVHTQVGNELYITKTNGKMEPIRVYYSPSLAGYYMDKPFSSTLPLFRFFPPFGVINALSTNVSMTTPAGPFSVGGTFTLTASSSYFTSNMVGKYIRLANSTTGDAVVKLTTYGSATTFTVTVIWLLGLSGSFAYGSTTNAASFWQVSDWGADVGYPKTVTSYQGRLIFGGSSTKPDTVWGSRISNIYDFSEVPPVNTTGVSGFASGAYTADNSRPFTLTPNSPQTAAIRALSSAKTLLIHTNAAEIVAYGSDGALGPNNVVFESSTSFGAEAVQPVRINNYSTFVQKGGAKLRDVVYNFNEDQYKSSDLSFVADHLFVTGETGSALSTPGIDAAKELTVLENESSVLFCRTALGRLHAVTLDRDYQVNAWAKVPLGYFDVEPIVHAMCSVEVDGRNVLMAAVERDHGAGAYISYEIMYDIVENTEKDQSYLDGAIRCVNPTPGIPNTTHYVNIDSSLYDPRYDDVEVHVVADDNYLGVYTVGNDADNTITLPSAYETVFVGFYYNGKIQTNNLMAGGQIGVPLGRIRRVDEVAVQLINTRSAWVGINDGEMEELALRSGGALLGTPEDPYTGLQVVPVPGGYDRDLKITIEQRRPGPLYVVYLAARGATNE